MAQSARIRGPIVSTADLSEHRRFFANAIGLQSHTTHRLGSAAASQLLGVEVDVLRTEFMQRAPTSFGVRLWQCEPVAQPTVRDPARGTDLDALKVIDFYAPDFERSIADLEKVGYSPKDAIATYELPEGVFREAHYWLADNLVCALLSGPRPFFRQFVTADDGNLSEPLSISAPVSDVQAVVDFYTAVFGFSSLYQYEIDNPSFDALVGSDENLKLTAINVGTDLRSPYLGIIDYGPVAASSRSLLGRSRPPARGLVGVEVLVSDIESLLPAVHASGAQLIAEPMQVSYPPYGDVISCLVEGPHGVVHHVIESLVA